jgi:hypothetical protein
LGRVIQINSGAKQRSQALKMTALALRTLAGPNVREAEQFDLGAFILENLRIISHTIDQAATAWEKRDYWVKADHFRMEWRWLDRIIPEMEKSLRQKDRNNLATLTAQIFSKVGNVEPPKRIPSTPPWEGAWQRLQASSAG